MTIIHRSAIVPYSAAQMYALVNDIRAYPEFLPWCKNSKIISENEQEVRAELILSFGGIQKAFTTNNLLHPHKMIEVRLVEGPFKRLEGFWRFESLGEKGCKIVLDLEFEVVGGIISFAVGPIFHQVANTLVDAFCKRAEEVYCLEKNLS